MKLSQLISIASAALVDFGDVPVKLEDPETGDWIDIQQVLKLHPYTLGLLDRKRPVNAIAISRHMNNAPDLVLNKKDDA